jgi:hypothetical protein
MNAAAARSEIRSALGNRYFAENDMTAQGLHVDFYDVDQVAKKIGKAATKKLFASAQVTDKGFFFKA